MFLKEPLNLYSGRSEVFQEVTLTASPTDDWKSFVVQQTPKFLVQTYSQD